MGNHRYVFDSNVFINLQRRHPHDVFESLWTALDKLIQDGTILSSAEVYDEIKVGDDFLIDWLNQRRQIFMPSDQKVQETVRKILESHGQMVLGSKKANGADPFVIALAKTNSCTVVTEETKSGKDNPPKIPNVCESYGVRFIDFVSFLRERGIRI